MKEGKYVIFKIKPEEITPIKDLIDCLNTPQLATYQEILGMLNRCINHGIRMQKKEDIDHLKVFHNMANYLKQYLYSYALLDIFHEILKSHAWMPNIAEIISIQEKVLRQQNFDFRIWQVKNIAERVLHYYNKNTRKDKK